VLLFLLLRVTSKSPGVTERFHTYFRSHKTRTDGDAPKKEFKGETHFRSKATWKFGQSAQKWETHVRGKACWNLEVRTMYVPSLRSEFLPPIASANSEVNFGCGEIRLSKVYKYSRTRDFL